MSARCASLAVSSGLKGGIVLAGDGDSDRWVAACSREQLSAQTILCRRVAGVSILVVQDGEDIFACERACPHEQADLSLGRVADSRLYCPRHLAWFSLVDGGISPGWSSRALRRYPVRVDGTHVWVDAKAVATP